MGVHEHVCVCMCVVCMYVCMCVCYVLCVLCWCVVCVLCVVCVVRVCCVCESECLIRTCKMIQFSNYNINI